MKTTRIPRIGVCLLFILAAGRVQAEPLLNGLAVSTEFGKERFIAALYTDRLTEDAQEVLSSTGERRMELKITADSISARSINSMWVEGMAINNPSSALEAQAENLAKLNNFVRKRLRAGDVLTFNAVEGQGTAVSLNGIKLGAINSDGFFPMLLRTWIGSIPLSSEFKTDLLAGGDVDGELSSRYARIEPDDARVEAVAGWVAPKPPAPEVAAGPAIQPPKPDTRITPPAPPSTTTQEPEAEPEPQVAKAPEPAPAGSTPESKPEPSKPAKVARAPAPEPVAEEEDEAEEMMVTAESLLQRQRYISDVMRQTLRSMRYPRRAQERGQQGSIRLAVTVARDGALQNVKIVQESRYNLLNREALDSVERASPFPDVPEGILGDTFSFGIPVTFQLQ